MPRSAHARPLLSLAAGTVLDVDALEAIRVAAAAGFEGVGVRLDPALMDRDQCRAIAAALSASGLMLLDLEVMRLQLGDADDGLHLRLVDLAAELGARHVLAISYEPDPGRTVERFRGLCERAEANGTGTRVALEFPAYTGVRNLEACVGVVTAAGHPLGAVLVDSLHLARTGGRPEQLREVPRGLLTYVQICDAASAEAREDDGANMAEARGGRLMPGEGTLPLKALLDQFRARPEALGVSVEVMSTDLAARYTAAERARMAFDAGTAFLAEGWP